MTVLQAHPVALLRALGHQPLRDGALALAERHHLQVVALRVALRLGELQQVLRRVGARGEHKHDGHLARRVVVRRLQVKGRWLLERTTLPDDR